MLELTGIFVVVLVAVVLVIVAIAASKPATFHVERSTTIAATPAHIVPLVADFHSWEQWSPWAKRDPAMRTTYSGPPAGPGAVYEWEGNRKVGKGRMEVLSATSAQTDLKLDFLAPLEGHNTSSFRYVPEDGNTRVVWSMDGPNTFMGKIMSVFISMDSMIGGDFERGLANLKTAAERQ